MLRRQLGMKRITLTTGAALLAAMVAFTASGVAEGFKHGASSPRDAADQPNIRLGAVDLSRSEWSDPFVLDADSPVAPDLGAVDALASYALGDGSQLSAAQIARLTPELVVAAVAAQMKVIALNSEAAGEGPEALAALMDQAADRAVALMRRINGVKAAKAAYEATGDTLLAGLYDYDYWKEIAASGKALEERSR